MTENKERCRRKGRRESKRKRSIYKGEEEGKDRVEIASFLGSFRLSHGRGLGMRLEWKEILSKAEYPSPSHSLGTQK